MPRRQRYIVQFARSKRVAIITAPDAVTALGMAQSYGNPVSVELYK